MFRVVHQVSHVDLVVEINYQISNLAKFFSFYMHAFPKQTFDLTTKVHRYMTFDVIYFLTS